MEARGGEAGGGVRGCRVSGVGAVGVEGGGEGCAEGEPETAEGAEDDEGEGVAEEELEEAAEGHEHAALLLDGVSELRSGFGDGMVELTMK